MVIEQEIRQNGHHKQAESKRETFHKKVNSPFAGNQTLSVIIRCHKEERLPFLEEAIFSLSIQDVVDIEVIVVIQNGTDGFKRNVLEIINHQPWQKEPLIQIHSVEIMAGVDGRSTLLTYGITQATGRYLAFLDDDDVVYQHGYRTLIQQLIEGNCPVAVGGCRTAKTTQEFNQWYIHVKETPFTAGRNRYDLFRDNFMPIHSYVIDRERVEATDLFFDDEMPPLEDYDFLLRLSSKYEFDFSQLDVFVCEYRIHTVNSIPYTANATSEQILKYQRAFQLIEERKKKILCLVPLPDLIAIGVQPEQPKPEEIVVSENSRILQKVLISFGDKIYDFFHNYPRLEKRLSNFANYWWKVYKKDRSAASNQKETH